MSTTNQMLIDLGAFAELVGCCRQHLENMEKDGLLGPRPILLGKRAIRYRVDEVRDWIAAGAPKRAEWEITKTGGNTK